MEKNAEYFIFEPKIWPIITGYQARNLLNCRKDEFQLKLGKREVTIFRGKNKLFFSWEYPEWGKKKIKIPLKSLEIPKRHVYTIFPDKKFSRASMFRDSYYQLIAPHPHSSFTVEIDGVHMHAIKNTTPLKVTRGKVSLLNISPREKILDICTGLGYSAIEAKEKGGEVKTIEKNKEVLQLAQLNPYSEKLAGVPIIVGDAVKVLPSLFNEKFDKIFHDPPRFSLGGELYSLRFYEGLYRVLQKRGLLYHYTGNPGVHQERNIKKGIKNRLRKAGFKILTEKKGGFLLQKR